VVGAYGIWGDMGIGSKMIWITSKRSHRKSSIW